MDRKNIGKEAENKHLRVKSRFFFLVFLIILFVFISLSRWKFRTGDMTHCYDKTWIWLMYFIVLKMIKLVYFCSLILSLKIKENKVHSKHIVSFFKKLQNMTQTKKKEIFSSLWRRHRELVKSGLQMFQAEGFQLNDGLWSDKWVKVDCNQIKTLLENNQCYMMRKITNIENIQTKHRKSFTPAFFFFFALMCNFHISYFFKVFWNVFLKNPLSTQVANYD